MSATLPERDVIIAGGGALAAAIARECARRGFAVTLLEPDALQAAERMPSLFPETPWIAASGPEGRLARVRALRALAAHRGRDRRALALELDSSLRTRAMVARLEAGLAWASRSVDQGHTRLGQRALRVSEPRVNPGAVGALDLPCHSVDSAALALALARDAEARGAEVLWGWSAEKSGARGVERWVRASARVGGDSLTRSARVVVDATRDARLARAEGFDVKLASRTIVALEGALCEHVIGEAAPPRGARSALIVPEGLATWVRVDDAEPRDKHRSRRLARARDRAARLVPSVADAAATFVGAETVACGRLDPAEVHPAGERLLVAIAPDPIDWLGLALSAVVEVARAIGADPRRATAIDALPAGPLALHDAHFVATSLGVVEASALALGARRGADVEPVARQIGDERHRRALLCVCSGVLEAEVRQGVEEGACDLEALARRTSLGLGPCSGARCAHRAAQLVAQLRGLGARDAVDMHRRFVHARAAEADSSGAALASEELALARLAAGAPSPVREAGRR